MTPHELATIRRRDLGLTQQELADKLKTTRVSIARYETGARRIPATVELVVRQLRRPQTLPMAGIVAAGKPIEAVEQNESIEVPPTMMHAGNTFVLKVAGESMREDGMLPGDFVVVRKQTTANSGERVIALINGQATVKRYYPKGSEIELRPMNKDMDPVLVKRTDDFRVEGVVVGLIRHYR
jgi:repressor LexA